MEDYGHEPNVSTVSPTVGRELVKNAIKALSFAALGIIIYVAFRFEWRMGVGAIVSLFMTYSLWWQFSVYCVLKWTLPLLQQF